MERYTKLRILASALAAVFLFLSPGCGSRDKEQIRDIFDSFTAASHDKRGADAAACLSPVVFKYFEKLLIVAKDGSKEQIMALTPAERYEVARMRHYFKRVEIDLMDARSYIVTAVERGAFFWDLEEDGGSASDALGMITVKSSTATANIPTYFRKKKYSIRFTREDDGWKFDYASMDAQFNDEIKVDAKLMGMTVDGLIFSDIEDRSGKPVRKDIYDRFN